jgi:hypothetical protein
MKSMTVVVTKLVEPGALSNECLRFTSILYHIGPSDRAACGQTAPKEKSIMVVVTKFVEPVALSNECLRFAGVLYHIGPNNRAACGQAAPE